MPVRPLECLEDLPQLPGVAVIINCNTRVVTTLAIASVMRHGQHPLLLIDCESRDGSVETFAKVADEQGWNLFLMRWPLRPHGETLDALFRKAPTGTVLLVDSDLEILQGTLVPSLVAMATEDAAAYGAGFMNPEQEIGPPLHLVPPGAGRFAARMWIPLVLLKVDPVRRAIMDGCSFAATREYREIPEMPRLSRLLYYRFRLPIVRALPVLRRPAFVDFDTGAKLHQSLSCKGLHLAASDNWAAVRHFHGVTRAAIGGLGARLATRLRMVAPAEATNPEMEARRRLREAYGIELA